MKQITSMGKGSPNMNNFVPSQVKSIAIVGANTRFACRVMLENLKHIGFEGEIYLVNPKYEKIDGIACYPSLVAIQKPIDVVVGLVGPSAMIDVVRQAGQLGAKLFLIPGGGYGEGDGEGKDIQEKLLEEAEKYQLRIMGPNCMGYIDLANNFTPYIGTIKERNLKKGTISAVVHSGSVADAILAAPIGLNRVYSTGNEVDLGMADYVESLAKDPHTSVIILFIEAIRNPDKFLQALQKCRESEKPVIGIKTGKTERSTAMALAHSGALAGDWLIEKLVLEEHGVIFVEDIDEAIAAASMLSQPYIPTAGGMGAVTVSGGQAGLTLDIADQVGVIFPELSESATDYLYKEISESAPFTNPLDVWGKSKHAYDELYHISIESLIRDENIGIVAIAIDAPAGQGDHEAEFTVPAAKKLAEFRQKSTKPFVFFQHINSELDPRVLTILQKAGIPAIKGTRNGLVACKAHFKYRDFLQKAKSPIFSLNSSQSNVPLLMMNEDESREMLDQYGIPSPAEKVVTCTQEAIQFAREIGYPVVLKAQVDGLAHKTDVGGVALGLKDEEALVQAWNGMSHLNTNRFLVQEMIQDGFEVILSYKTDARYGPIVIFGLGGILTELLKDVVIATPPITREKALQMVQSVEAAWKIVNGYRGRPALDLEALLDVIVRMGKMAEENYQRVVEFEINPVIVRSKGRGVNALDVLSSIRSDALVITE